MAGAASFSVQTAAPLRAARELENALGRVPRPAGAVVFASGELGLRLPALAAELSQAARGIPLAIAAGAGVLSDRGEIERDAAVSGLVWAGGRAEVLSISAATGDEAGEALARALEDRSSRSAPTSLLFARPEGFSPHSLEPLRESRAGGVIFGAGTLGVDPIVVDADGRVSGGRAVALLLRGLAAPALRASPACRLLTPLSTVTETRGALVTRIGTEPALDVLSAAGEGLEGQPLIFAALASTSKAAEGRPELLLRAVQGVDPVRRGLLVSDEVQEGMSIAFAVRDAAAARADLESAVRELGRDTAGAAPRFALFLSCAGRGSALYGLPDVDTKILRARFGDLPFAGLHSSFEIAPYAGRPALQLFTGVVALFSAPS